MNAFSQLESYMTPDMTVIITTQAGCAGPITQVTSPIGNRSGPIKFGQLMHSHSETQAQIPYIGDVIRLIVAYASSWGRLAWPGTRVEVPVAADEEIRSFWELRLALKCRQMVDFVEAITEALQQPLRPGTRNTP